jgi:hypothetical protein
MNFDKKKFSVWTWKSPLILHWILNPGVVFNDLILGQRVPKIVLIEKGGRKSLPERTYVPCPHCNTLHSNLKWTPQNNTAFKNWFGLYCDNCEKIIPCVRNLTSLIILTITFPIWYWFKDKWKQQWLTTQKEKFSKSLVLTPPNYNWWYIGIKQAIFMFVTMSFTDFVILKEVFSWRRLILKAVIWTIGGLMYGLFMKKFGGNKTEKQSDIKYT